MLRNRRPIVLWALMATFLSLTSYANCCGTYADDVDENHDEPERPGPCPKSACTNWPLLGTVTPLPLPDEQCPYNGAGFLGGLQAGYGNTHWSIDQNNVNLTESPDTILDPNSVSNDGIAARVYVGYDFNYYFGIESGYTYLPQVSASGVQIQNRTAEEVEGKISNYTIDLLAKVMFPATDKFGVYVKGGGAYYRSGASGFLFFSGDGEDDESLNNIGLALGLGIFYHIVPNLSADISWMRYYGSGDVFTTTQNPDGVTQPNPDAFLLGVFFKFSPRYIE